MPRIWNTANSKSVGNLSPLGGHHTHRSRGCPRIQLIKSWESSGLGLLGHQEATDHFGRLFPEDLGLRLVSPDILQAREAWFVRRVEDKAAQASCGKPCGLRIRLASKRRTVQMLLILDVGKLQETLISGDLQEFLNLELMPAWPCVSEFRIRACKASAGFVSRSRPHM